MKKIFWEMLGIFSVLMLFFGVPLAIRESSRDFSLFMMWLVIAIVGLIGLLVIAIKMMIIKKRANTPREKDKEK